MSRAITLLILASALLAGCFEPPEPPDHPVGWLQTSGNGFVLDGEPWAGRGANFHDTRYCGSCAGHEADDELLDEVKSRAHLLVDTWGVDFVRLNLESHAEPPSEDAVHWAGILDDERYLADLVALVDYLGEHPGVFVELAPLTDASFDASGWPTDDTVDVVMALVETFYASPHVLFGLGHPPVSDGDDDALWQRYDELAAAIREVEDFYGAPHHVIVAPGTDRGGSVLDHYLDHPLTAGDGTDIAYEVHVVDGPDLYEERVFEPAQSLPVIIGYLGPDPLGVPDTSTAEDNLALMEQAHAAGIPYAARTFHWSCGEPNLLRDDLGDSCGVGAELTPSDPWGTAFLDAHGAAR